jgi:hypothetical protein
MNDRRGTYTVRGVERRGEIIGYEAYPGKPEVYTIREDGTGRIHRVRPSQMRQPDDDEWGPDSAQQALERGPR